MTGKVRLCIVVTGLCGACALLGGCAHTSAGSRQAAVESRRDAATLEQQGDLAEAVERLQIALTLDPKNGETRAALERLQERRNREAERLFQAGQANAGSNPLAAQQAYLGALRLKPDYPEALTALRELQRTSSEATIRARIKKFGGTPTGHHGKERDEDAQNAEVSSLDAAIALYEEGSYPEAIRELLKARGRMPHDPEVQKYLNLAWYQHGILLFNRRDYKKALEAFGKARKEIGKADDYIHRSRQALHAEAERLYREGLKFFREQKLEEAINRWNMVLELEPAHAKAKEYTERARKLLAALRQHR